MSSPETAAASLWQPGRAAIWAAAVSAALIVVTVVPLLFADPRTAVPAEPTLGVDPVEVLPVIATLPLLFGVCFLVALLLLRRRAPDLGHR